MRDQPGILSDGPINMRGGQLGLMEAMLDKEGVVDRRQSARTSSERYSEVTDGLLRNEAAVRVALEELRDGDIESAKLVLDTVIATFSGLYALRVDYLVQLRMELEGLRRA